MLFPTSSSETGPIVVDLRDARHLSAADLTELVRLRKRLPDERIVLFRPRPMMLRILRTVGFDAMFEIAE